MIPTLSTLVQLVMNNREEKISRIFCIFVIAILLSTNLQGLAQKQPEQSSTSIIEQLSVLQRHGQTKKAYELLKEAVVLFPKDPIMRIALYNYQMKQKMYKEALKEADAYIALAPNSASPYVLRALALTKLGQFNDALIGYAKAESMHTGSTSSASFFEGRGRCKLGLGNVQSAKADLQIAALKYLDSEEIFLAQDCVDLYKQAEIKALNHRGGPHGKARK
ncbi:MAG: hypothetical protein K2W82_12735 [Candidatus Obscuribacterales bacterium]|nr:hypothetical protein [Candidatus Obscuribacterales bacterium]